MLGLNVGPSDASRQAGEVDPAREADNAHLLDQIGVCCFRGIQEGSKKLPVAALGVKYEMCQSDFATL